MVSQVMIAFSHLSDFMLLAESYGAALGLFGTALVVTENASFQFPDIRDAFFVAKF